MGSTTGAAGRLIDADSAPCTSLDRICRAAAQHARTGRAHACLATADGWVVAGSAGPPMPHTSCRVVVESDAPRLISDPAYAGFPLRGQDGRPIGAFCVLDDQPHVWEPGELLLVEDLAAAAATEIGLRAEARQHAAQAGRLQRVLDVCQDAYVAIDVSGRVRSWNDAAERLFGYPAAAAVGRPVADLIIPDRYRAAHEAGLARLRDGAPSMLSGQRIELVARNRSGAECPIEMTLQVDGTEVHAFLHDITERVAERRQQQHAATERELRLAVARALADATSAAEAANGTLAAVAHALNWAFGEFWQADEESGAITRVGHWTAPAHDLSAVAAARPFSVERGVGLAGHVWQTGAGLWSTEVADDPRLLIRADQIRAAGLHSAIGLPVRSGERVLGVLLLFSARTEERDAAVLDLLDGVCAQLGRYFERRRAEELTLALAAARRDFDRVIEQVDDYVWTVEVRPDGSIHPVYGSAGSAVVTGRPAAHRDFEAAMNGRIHPDDRHLAEGLFKTVLAGEHAENEVRMIGPDGNLRWVWTRARPRDEDGRLLVDGITTDVTERRQLADQREGLIALVSHELRNPLATIRTYAEELLQDAALTGDHRHLTEIIDKHSAHMQHLVDDLLDMARLEAGQLHVDPAPTPLGGLLREAVEAQRVAAAAKPVTLLADVRDDLPVRADPVRLRQVLDNLLANAIKYTPAGGSVSVTAGHAEDEVVVTVTDTGIGIPAEEYAQLFDRFFRASNAIRQGIKGTGLGLAITKAIVEAHGGRVTAGPAPGGGCSFTARLPAVAQE